MFVTLDKFKQKRLVLNVLIQGNRMKLCFSCHLREGGDPDVLDMYSTLTNLATRIEQFIHLDSRFRGNDITDTAAL